VHFAISYFVAVLQSFSHARVLSVACSSAIRGAKVVEGAGVAQQARRPTCGRQTLLQACARITYPEWASFCWSVAGAQDSAKGVTADSICAARRAEVARAEAGIREGAPLAG